jgi:polyhydroxyalkanoate synthase subunit PhaC
MSANTDPTRPASPDTAAAPLDLLLSTSGHVAAIVNPPGNDKASYQVGKECPDDPQEWLRRAETCHGSWWPDDADWLAERCGEERAAPRELGGGGLAPICDAPGTYVYDH